MGAGGGTKGGFESADDIARKISGGGAVCEVCEASWSSSNLRVCPP